MLTMFEIKHIIKKHSILALTPKVWSKLGTKLSQWHSKSRNLNLMERELHLNQCLKLRETQRENVKKKRQRKEGWNFSGTRQEAFFVRWSQIWKQGTVSTSSFLKLSNSTTLFSVLFSTLMHSVTILPPGLRRAFSAPCYLYTVLLFPLLALFESLPLLDAALNGKSIGACLFVKPKELHSTAQHL